MHLYRSQKPGGGYYRRSDFSATSMCNVGYIFSKTGIHLYCTYCSKIYLLELSNVRKVLNIIMKKFPRKFLQCKRTCDNACSTSVCSMPYVQISECNQRGKKKATREFDPKAKLVTSGNFSSLVDVQRIGGTLLMPGALTTSYEKSSERRGFGLQVQLDSDVFLFFNHGEPATWMNVTTQLAQ